MWSGTKPATVQLKDQGWVVATWLVPAGETFAATCRVALPETAKPFWCIPGIFWGDNQQDSTGQYYPRFRADLTKPAKFQSSFWELSILRAAQPVVAMFDGTAWWVLEVSPEAGDLCPSVGFEFAEGLPTLVASLPASERPYRHVGHAYTMPVIGHSVKNKYRKITWLVRTLRIEGSRTSLLDFLQANYHAAESQNPQLPAVDYAKATRLHRQLYPFFKAIFLDPNPVPIKVALVRSGIITSAAVRPPLSDLTPAYLPVLIKALATARK